MPLFEGQQSDPYSYLAKAAFFILPSLYEGTSNALLEAMSCGTVPIVSDAITGKLVEDKHNGFVFKVRDVDELTKTMLEAIHVFENNPSYYESYARKCIKTIEPFNEQTVLTIWDNVIKGSTA